MALVSILRALAALLVCFAAAVGAPSSAFADDSPSNGHTFDVSDVFLLGTAPVLGPDSAIVTIVMFSEFQCPFCARVQPTLADLMDRPEFAGKIRIVHKHLPLGFHDQARPAAIASVAAHRQGAFWEFAALAYANQRDLSSNNYEIWAASLGLDLDRFRADIADPDASTEVDTDAALAAVWGIQGTPNFLINGAPLTGAQPIDAFVALVSTEVAATEALIAQGMGNAEALTARINANAASREQARAGTGRAGVPEPDPDQVLRVPLGDDPHVIGPDDALVTIVAFSEFQCPFCSRTTPTLRALRERYGNQLRIVFRHLPLDFHENARLAAAAAIAAHNQGEFWAYHDLLFENQQNLRAVDLLAYAGRLDLDLAQFQDDLYSEATAARIDADIAAALQLRAQGTPHFFINGIRVVGAMPIESFITVIDERLAIAEAAVEAGADRDSIYDILQASADTQVRMITPPGGTANPPARPEPDNAVEMWVPIDQAPVRGPDDALVTIVVFSEFQCPFCSRVLATLTRIADIYGDDVRFVFRHRPLDFHDRALPAARAAIAAQNQGRFWEYHDLLFANQRDLQDADLFAYAAVLGMDIAQFSADMASPATQARIDADVALADRLVARGTPHFFINGMRLRGAQPYEAFVELIDAQLAIARQAIDDGADRATIYDTLQSDAEQGPAPMIMPE